jgi:hypothetical protein
MLRKRKRPIKIRVALDSIIYAPLYVFVQQDSLKRTAPFRFYVEPVHKGITLEPQEDLVESGSIYQDLLSLGPIYEDPVFSPVCDQDWFREEPRTWFGVGDPLRAHRLKLYRGSSISYQFVGTLVSRLAFWIITEQRRQLQPEYMHRFNYVTCHSRGMTGHYVAEVLFRTERNNPLAPVYAPGREVDQVFNFLSQDWPRRTGRITDPVWAAAVSTEIGRMLTLRNMHKKEHRTVIEPLYQTIGRDKIPSDFLFTAVVARTDNRNAQEISHSSAYLKQRLIETIKLLREDPAEFCRNLAAFYTSHASFTLPAGSRPFWLQRGMKDIAILEYLQGLYPLNDLYAPRVAKLGTDWLLTQAILQDIRPRIDNPPFPAIFEELRPDRWEAADSLWS